MILGSEAGFEIDISGDKIHIRCTSTTDTFDKEQLSILKNTTNKFMEQFAFRSILLQQQKEQLAILHAHPSTIAFRRSRRNTYLIGTKKSEIDHIMQKLLFKQPLPRKPTAQDSKKPSDQK